ncbi:hypothetical protein Bca101_018230 [Brassica carinata]
MLRLVRVFIGLARSADLCCMAVHSLISLVLVSDVMECVATLSERCVWIVKRFFLSDYEVLVTSGNASVWQALGGSGRSGLRRFDVLVT